MEVVTKDFRAMASDVRVIVVDPFDGALTSAKRRLEALESAWSRFRADSDVTAIGVSRGGWVSVVPETITLIEAMQCGAAVTDGSYDPTMVRELIDVGYTESFDGSGALAYTVDLPSIGFTISDVVLDSERRRVWAPASVAIDPGGIGKGLAADLVVASLLAAGAGGALVSVGGDIRVDGRAPADEGWVVTVGDPLDEAGDVCTVAVDRGGIATSSTTSRTWEYRGAVRHHQIDPNTRAGSPTDLASATVFAATGWEAEVHATALVLAGSAGFDRYLAELDLSGVAVTTDGERLFSPGLSASSPPLAAA